jgi:hypothetical protein
MGPSTRTPEGEPNRCPVCGKHLRIEPSRPPGDAPCPHCGHLLWFNPPCPGGDFFTVRRATEEVFPRLGSQLSGNKLAALLKAWGQYVYSKPITVRRRRLLFGIMSWTSFDCRLWIQGWDGSWRVLLSAGKHKSPPEETMVGADFCKGNVDDPGEGKVTRFAAWSYATGEWQMISGDEAANVYLRVEDAIDRAYDRYCTSGRWR